jgi:hypothetical protein
MFNDSSSTDSVFKIEKEKVIPHEIFENYNLIILTINLRGQWPLTLSKTHWLWLSKFNSIECNL